MATQDPENPGVLVLSPFAGAACELAGVIIANPYDADAVAESLQEALQMSREERVERWQAMMVVLRRNSISAWRESFLRVLGEANGHRRPCAAFAGIAEWWARRRRVRNPPAATAAPRARNKGTGRAIGITVFR